MCVNVMLRTEHTHTHTHTHTMHMYYIHPHIHTDAEGDSAHVAHARTPASGHTLI